MFCSQTRSGTHMPRTARRQPVLEPAGVAADLADAVAARNHRQDRLEIRPADNFDSAGCNEARQAVEVVGVMSVEPFHQRAAGVQGHLQRSDSARTRRATASSCLDRPARRRGRSCRRAGGRAGRDRKRMRDGHGRGRLRWSTQSVSVGSSSRTLIGKWNAFYPVCLVGIFCAFDDAISRLSHESGRLFRAAPVDVKTGPPLKAGRLRQTRNNLYMPVIVPISGVSKGAVWMM